MQPFPMRILGFRKAPVSKGMNSAPRVSRAGNNHALRLERLWRIQRHLLGLAHSPAGCQEWGVTSGIAQQSRAAVQKTFDCPVFAIGGVILHLCKDFAPHPRTNDQYLVYQRIAPPSMTRLVPVTQRLASESRYTAALATSSGVPRPRGVGFSGLQAGRLPHRRDHGRRGYAVDPDLALGLLQCQTANDARQASLHCRVGAYTASADVCSRGEQKNDGPARFERSCLEQALGQHDRREKVDGIHVCHRLLTELPDWAVLLLSRAMHQTID